MTRDASVTGAACGAGAPADAARPRADIASKIKRTRQAMTKVDCLIEVAKKLKEARTLGERCSDRALLYFIDMTIAHVCDSLDSAPRNHEGWPNRARKSAERVGGAKRPGVGLSAPALVSASRQLQSTVCNGQQRVAGLADCELPDPCTRRQPFGHKRRCPRARRTRPFREWSYGSAIRRSMSRSGSSPPS